MNADIAYLASEIVGLTRALQEDHLNAHTLISNKIHELVDPKDEALRAAWHDLLDVASGYDPYRWNHELNPFCETLVRIGAALKLPPWKIFTEADKPLKQDLIEPPLCPYPQDLPKRHSSMESSRSCSPPA